MEKRTYNNQDITAYLLGSLPEAETERFDELSFTDDEFADELKSAEKDLVDAYVNGELKGTRLDRFKSYYLASPFRRGKVNFAQAFQVFAEKHEEVSVVVESKPKRTFAGVLSVLNIFTMPRPVLQWGFAAAALAFMFVGGWLWFENSRLRNQVGETQARRDALLQRERELQRELEEKRTANSDAEKELARVREERERLEQELKKEKAQEQQRIAEQRAAKQQQQSSPVSIASFILLPQMRGSNQIQNLSIPARTDYVAMKLQLESDDYAVYRVTLINQSNNQTLWRSNKLKTKTKGANKTINIRFPASLLKSQIYSLEVAGINTNGAAEIVSDYPFKVVRQ